MSESKHDRSRAGRVFRDPRFFLSTGSILLYAIVLPREPCGCVYFAEVWGRATLLMAAALLLWLGYPAGYLTSSALSAFTCYLAGERLISKWIDLRETFPNDTLIALSGEGSWWRIVVTRLWEDGLVFALALAVFCFGVVKVIRRLLSMRVALP